LPMIVNIVVYQMVVVNIMNQFTIFSFRSVPHQDV